MYGNLISEDTDSRNGEQSRSARHFQRFYLERLRRMVGLRQEHGRPENVGNQEQRLLDRAIYCTLCECLDLGVGEEARAILRHEDDDVRGNDPEKGRSDEADS